MRPKVRTSDGRTFTSWSKAEMAFMRRYFSNMNSHEIAKRLGKTEKAVRTKAFWMKLRKSAKRLTQMGRENVALRGAR